MENYQGFCQHCYQQAIISMYDSIINCIMRKPAFCICETKAQISYTLIINTFVFPTQIVQFLLFLNRKFQASSHLLRLYRLVFTDLVGNPKDRFSLGAALMILGFWTDRSRQTVQTQIRVFIVCTFCLCLLLAL